MKRYLVFAGDTHEAFGGWSDFQISYDNPGDALTVARAFVTTQCWQWSQVVDLETAEITSIGEQKLK